MERILNLLLLFLVICSVVVAAYGHASAGSSADGSRACGDRRAYGDGAGSEGVYVHPYRCPFVDDPPAYTRCCTSPPEYGCCLPKESWTVDLWTAIAVTALIVILLLVVTIGLVLCVCWDRCPLYGVCRRRAKPDYIAHPDDVACLSDTMPSDNINNVRIYHFDQDKSGGHL